MKSSRDRILDAFLDEMLNDSRPARSAAEIARQVESRLPRPGDKLTQGNALPPGVTLTQGDIQTQGTQGNMPPAGEDPAETFLAGPELLPSTETPAPAGSPAPHPATPPPHRTDPPLQPASRNPRSASKPDWISILSIAGLVVAAATLSIWLMQPGPDPVDIAVNNDPSLTGSTDRSRRQAPSQQNDPQNNLAQGTERPGVPENPRPLQPAGPDDESPRIAATSNEIPEDQNRLVLPPEFERSNVVDAVALSPRQMADAINRRLQASWTDHNLQPARPLELRNWVNRLSSRLIGRTLNADELPAVNGLLVQGKSPEAIRRDLIDYFLESPEYQSGFNQHWGQTLAWDMLGISQSMNASDPDMTTTRDLLVEKIAARQPLDQVAYELISAVGSTDPAGDDFNAAASYLVALTKRFGNRELASAHVARSFLGRGTQCARCHDGFGEQALADSTQREFFEFHAFFAQLRFERMGEADSGHFYVANRNYLPLSQQGRVEAAIRYTDPEGREHEVFPRLGDETPGSNGFVARVDRRSELARLIAGSPEFRETMVDHVWANLLNIPISGMDGNSDPELARLRRELGEQFAANQFDLHWLVTAITASEAFAVGVGTDEQLAANNPFLGVAPRFNVFYHRLENRRSAIQSLGIVAQAYRSGDVEPALSAGLLARINETVDSQPRTILPFVPGKDSQWASSPSISRQLDMIADSSLSARQKVEHVVLAALGRPAREQEIEQALVILENGTSQQTALQDVWWSLLNSVEYHLPLGVR